VPPLLSRDLRRYTLTSDDSQRFATSAKRAAVTTHPIPSPFPVSKRRTQVPPRDPHRADKRLRPKVLHERFEFPRRAKDCDSRRDALRPQNVDNENGARFLRVRIVRAVDVRVVED
jgi:hypothetical protein